MAADKQLSINISAKNGASPAFQQVANDATKLGTAVAQSTTKASTAFDELQKHAALFGTMVGTTLVRSLKDFAAAGEENARATRQLQAAVEDAGQSYEDFAGSLEKAASSAAQFGISDDKATNALQALVEHTHDAQKAMDLLQTTENLAAAKHLDLVDAANLIGKVYDGNTAILKRYGVAIADGATAEQALAQINTQFAGQAEANTSVLSRFDAEMENWKGKIGEAMGPLSGLITLLPGISTGAQIATTGGGILIDMFRAQKAAALEAAVGIEAQTVALEAETVAAAEASAAGAGAAVAEGGLLASLTGPAGLVIALGAAAAGVAYLIHQHNAESDSLKEVTLNVDDLTNAYKALAAAGTIGPSNLGQLFTIKGDVSQLSAQRDAELADAKAKQTALSGMVVGYNPATQGSQEAANFQAQVDEQTKIAQGQIANEEKLAGSASGLVAANKELAQIYANLGDSGVDATRVTNELNDAFVKYNKTVADGHPDLATLETDIATIKSGMYENTKAATDAIDAWTKMSAAMRTAWDSAAGPLANADAQIKHIGASMDSTALSAQTLVNGALAQFNHVIESGDGTGRPQALQIADAYKVLGDTLAAVDKQLSDQEGIHAFTASLGDLVHPVQDANDQITKAVTDVMNSTGAVAETQKAVVSRALSELNAELAMDGGDVDAASASWAKFWDAVSGANAAISAAAAAKKMADAKATYQAAWNPTTMENPSGAKFDAFTAAAKKARDDAMKQAQAEISAAGLTPSYAGMQGAGGNATAAIADGAERATQALDTTYNALIKNTDAIAKQSDEIAKWADGLIGAQGVASKMDDLANKHLITGQSGVFTGNNDYANAQRANNAIAADNAKIQDEILAIQVKQAPVIADLIGKEAAYIDTVRLMKPAQQTAALGFMDATESAKAQNLVLLAGQAAMGQLGEAGGKAAQQIIVGAAEADPVLASMLQSMGLISIGAKGEITITTKGMDGAKDEMTKLTDALTELVAILDPTHQFKLDTTDAQAAQDALNASIKAGNELLANAPPAETGSDGAHYGNGASIFASIGGGDTTQTVTVDVQSDAAKAKIKEITDALDGIPPTTTPTVGMSDQASAKVAEIMAGINGLPDHTSTVNADTANAMALVTGFGGVVDGLPDHTSSVTADVYGTGDVEYLSGIINGLQDKSVSVYATTYYSSVGASGAGVGISSGNMLGGVIQRHASGGVASWLAEAGPELLDFPGGGHGMAYNKGVYTVPEGTFVHTAPATKAMTPNSAARNYNHYGNVYHYPSSGADARDSATASIAWERRS